MALTNCVGTITRPGEINMKPLQQVLMCPVGTFFLVAIYQQNLDHLVDLLEIFRFTSFYVKTETLNTKPLTSWVSSQQIVCKQLVHMYNDTFTSSSLNSINCGFSCNTLCTARRVYTSNPHQTT